MRSSDDTLVKLAVTGLCVMLLLLLFAIPLGLDAVFGVGAFGPKRVCTATVQRLYVDTSGSGDTKQSHYMVGTDAGVFEVDNSVLMWLWNADELYARLQEGHCYRITTKGNTVVNWAFQEYPYIIDVQEVAGETR